MGSGKRSRRGGRRGKGDSRTRAGAVGSQGRFGSALNRGALSFEALEDRSMLAVFLVLNTGDLVNGNTVFGSLRWAIQQANAEDNVDTIVFADTVFDFGVPATIALNGGSLNITQPVSILGPGPRALEVTQTTANSRVFDINIGADDEFRSVEISGLTISGGGLNGNDARGGGIHNRELLTMTEVVLTNNFAPGGGGAIYNEFGRLTLERSLVTNNTGGGDLVGERDRGGAILNGGTSDENVPRATITDSTFSGNGGGAIKNSIGTVNIWQSTIILNDYGVVSWGNPPPEEEGEDPPAPTVFTNVYSSILFFNDESDIVQVGMTDDDPPGPLEPAVTSEGNNIIGVVGPDTELQGTGPTDKVGPANDPLFLSDPFTMEPLLLDYGGSTDAYLLDPTSPAIDMGGPARSQFEQRGRHFTREYDYTLTGMPTADIGAVEMQFGTFIVDTLIDETNLIFSRIYTLTPGPGAPDIFPGGYEQQGNFSIREAIDFARKNPGLDSIFFAQELNSTDVLETEDFNASPAPTIILTLGALPIDEDLLIEGPENFIVEIDAVGNDVNPDSQNGTGTRVFIIDDGDDTVFSSITMSNLTIMGGDIISQGGGIYTFEDLALSRMTFKGNNATDDGGALYVGRGATVTIDRSTFNNNRAADTGGAIYVARDASVQLTSSTISGNRAGLRGAGILNDGGDVVVEYSTITLNNAASTRGSGIAAQGTSPTVDVKSTIISGNVANDVEFFGAGNSASVFTSSGWNFIGRGNAISAFTNNDVTFNTHGALATDPKLEPLTMTGGLIETHAPTYRPAQGIISPVLDMGDPTAMSGAGGVPDFDQRGPDFVRVFDVDGVGGGRIDIGAYELQGSTFLVSTLFDENDGDFSSGDFSLREAIFLANLNPLFDVVAFDPSLLTLSRPSIILGAGGLAPGVSADLRITTSMRIEWLGDDTLTVDGFALDNPSATIIGSRMFTIDDGSASTNIDVEILGGDNGIEFTNVRAPQGGGVLYSRENVTITNTRFINNVTIDPDERTVGLPADVDQTGLHGGALYQDGTGIAVRPTMTINGALFTGNLTIDLNADGGAIYVSNANLVLNDATVTGNSTSISESDGGGIALKNATFTSNFSTITGNILQGGASDGGGLHSDNSVVLLIESVVSGNHTVGGGSNGGGIFGVNSQITLENTVVGENNTFGSLSHGGGVYVMGASGLLTVNGSLIQDNATLGSFANGGGIAVDGSTAIINSSSVRLNTVGGNGSHGGGLWNNGGLLTVRGSTVAGNAATHAQSRGGGVYSDTSLGGGSLTTILNSTVSGNSAGQRGGGVYNADGRTDIKHSTITNNAVPTINSGSGVASFGNSATTLTTVQSSIIAGNQGVTGGTRTDIDAVDSSFNNTFQSLGFNLIGTGNALGAFGASDLKGVANPGLAPLADNGAPSNVFFPLQTHALVEGSQAVNAGSPSFNPNAFSPPLTMDEAGNNRVRKGRIDIGAFESDFAPSLPADFDGDNDVDGNDFLSWQRNVGVTGATKSQGDADGNGQVNGQDLAVWRSGYGQGGAVTAAASSSSTAASYAAQEAATSPEASGDTAAKGLSALGSLGLPVGVSSNAVPSEQVEEAPQLETTATRFATALAWDAEGDSLLDGDDDVSSLATADAGEEGAAEDAVFAAWGEELL